MLIIGCDYHPGFQQIAFVDIETGELGERRLVHREEAEQFYGKLREQSVNVRVGMEASGHARWFERLLCDLQFELWIGNAAEIRTKRVRRQKTDRQDAQLLLRLMMEGRFPRIWVADAENRDLQSQQSREKRENRADDAWQEYRREFIPGGRRMDQPCRFSHNDRRCKHKGQREAKNLRSLSRHTGEHSN